MSVQGCPKTGIETNVGEETKLQPMYKVLLHNDDQNDMAHVVYALNQVFNMQAGDASRIMFEAHNSGVALCKIEPLEHAELHRDQLQSYSLTATIEPDE